MPDSQLPAADHKPQPEVGAEIERKVEAEPAPEPAAVAAKLAIRDALDRKDAPAAQRLFDGALKRFPLDPDLREVQKRRALGQHDEIARTIFGRASADSAKLFGRQWLPGRTMNNGERGVGIVQLQRGARAVVNLDAAVEAAVDQSYRYLDRGDPARAEKVLSGAIRRHDTAAALYYARAIAHGMGGDLKKADEDSLRAVTLSREQPVALSQRASLMMTMGRREEAFAWASRALEGDSQDAYALVIRGQVLWLNHHRPDLAIEDFKKAAQIDPEYEQKLYEKWNRLFIRNRMEDNVGKNAKQALADAALILASDPTDERAHLTRGGVFMHAGKVEETIKETTLALKTNPQSKWALRFRAQALEILGARSRAIADCKRAAAIDPGRFRQNYEDLVRAQREGSLPIWVREGDAAVLADSH